MKIEYSNHIGEGGWSPEAISRAKKIQFLLYDIRTKKTIPILGIDAVDVSPNPTQIKLAKNLQTGEITLLDKGSKAFSMFQEMLKKGEKIKPIQTKQLKIMRVHKAKIRADQERQRRENYFK